MAVSIPVVLTASLFLAGAFPNKQASGGGSFTGGTLTSALIRETATVTAAGTNQATATPITSDVVVVNGGNGLDLVLPSPTAVGQTVLLLSSAGAGANNFDVWPASGERLAGTVAVDTSMRISLGLAFNNPAWLFVCTSITGTKTWATFALGAAGRRGDALNYTAGFTDLQVDDLVAFVLEAGPSTFASGITVSGATGVNFVKAPDNLAEAWWLGEGTNRYLTQITANGSEMLTHQKPLRGTIATPVAAAGSTIADCGAIPAGTVWIQITGADGTKGACLPTTTSVTTCVRIMNLSTSALLVYGADADTNPTVNGEATDAAYSQVAGTSLIYCNSGVAWSSY